MMTISTEERIQILSQAVLSEAQVEAERIVSEARAKAEAIRRQAQEQAAAERARILEQGHREAERIRGQAVATAQLKARTQQLEHREKLLRSVFEAAQQQLPHIQQWTDYEEIARQLLREALTLLGADTAQVRADRQTQLLLTDKVLAEISADMGVQMQIGAPLEHGIGVMVETMDGRRQYDNTLEARLSRLQDSLRAPVYRLLIGEAL